MTSPDGSGVGYAEGAMILDRAASRKLGISGGEFIDRWDRGEYAGGPEDVEAQEVAMLLPFARPCPIGAAAGKGPGALSPETGSW